MLALINLKFIKFIHEIFKYLSMGHLFIIKYSAEPNPKQFSLIHKFSKLNNFDIP